MATSKSATEPEAVEGPYPPLEEVVDRRMIMPGFEWAYIQAANAGLYQEDGWVLVPGSQPFVVDGIPYLVMFRGEGVRASISFVPHIQIDVAGISL